MFDFFFTLIFIAGFFRLIGVYTYILEFGMRCPLFLLDFAQGNVTNSNEVPY